MTRRRTPRTRRAREAERRRAAGGYAGVGGRCRWTSRSCTASPSRELLAEWAVIEIDADEIIYSTRPGGAPITFFKRLLARLLRQYFVELEARQTRFNIALLERLDELEERGRRVTAVHQVLSSAGPYDAVSVQARLWRELLTERGPRRRRPRRVGGPPRPRRLPAAGAAAGRRRGDLLVIRYSAYSPGLLRAARAPRAQAGRLPQRHAPGLLLEPPRGGGAGLRGRPRAAAAVRPRGHVWRRPTRSSTPRELRAAGAGTRACCRSCSTRAGWRSAGRAPRGDGPLVLVVSRLAPNKRHDLAIAAFAAWRAEHGGPRGCCAWASRSRRPTASGSAALAGDRRRAGGRAVPAGPERRVRGRGRGAVDVRARGLLGAAAGGVPLRRAGGGAAGGRDARGGRRRRAVGPRRRPGGDRRAVAARDVRRARCARCWPSGGGRGWPSTSTRAPRSGSLGAIEEAIA